MKVFFYRENTIDAIEDLNREGLKNLLEELKTKGEFSYMKNVDNILHVYIGLNQVREALEKYKVDDSQAFLNDSAAMF